MTGAVDAGRADRKPTTMTSDPVPAHCDLAIVGGGIVGLATAYQFTRRWPDRRVVVFEKESQLAAHQTGRNSGVLHSGIYYKPGSLKAITCRAGKAELEQFCATENVRFERCGKVIVAVTEAELPGLEKLLERGKANGVGCTRIGPEQLREIEPHVSGIAAIQVPETGIVDYLGVCNRLASRARESGGAIVLNARVSSIVQRPEGILVRSSQGETIAQQVVNCGGLHSDRIALLTGVDPGARIVPFRGEYFCLRPRAHHLVRHLIYPVPDPRFPFLGVHFTRMIDGERECGPNAVPAFAREGYFKTDVDLGDLLQTATYPGFIRLALKHWKMGLGEMWRSASKAAFVRALRRLIPAIEADDLEPAPAGIRAQAVARDGSLVDDFLIRKVGRIVNVVNAPSPAATASLRIGSLVVDELDQS